MQTWGQDPRVSLMRTPMATDMSSIGGSPQHQAGMDVTTACALHSSLTCRKTRTDQSNNALSHRDTHRTGILRCPLVLHCERSLAYRGRQRRQRINDQRVGEQSYYCPEPARTLSHLSISLSPHDLPIYIFIEQTTSLYAIDRPRQLVSIRY